MFSKRTLFILVIIACLSFIPSLFIGYVGEEAIYTISSYEMHYVHQYMVPVFLGLPYWRPPLFNWLIIPVADLIGWAHMLVASRLVTALATIGTAVFLMILSNRLFKNKSLAYFIGLIYLTSDASFYHGWMAYADPLFTFFSFGAVALLWLGVLDEKSRYFLLSLISLTAAYLTKALTVYPYFFIMLFALGWFYKGQLKYFFKPIHILLLILALLFPSFWSHITHNVNGSHMFLDITDKFTGGGNSSSLNFMSLAYWSAVGGFILELCFKLFPISILFFYFLIRKRFVGYKHFAGYREAMLALGVAILTYLPYLFSSATHEARYIMMIYPLLAMFLGVFFWNLKNTKSVLVFIIILLVVKYLMVCLVLPIYSKEYRGDYLQVAQMVLEDTKARPLYYQDFSATGESVLAYIDLQRAPQAPLTMRVTKPGPYFLVRPADQPDENSAHERLYKVYPLGRSGQKIELFESINS